MNKSLQAFTYSVAHDLSTPLRGLNGFSEILLEEYAEHLDETGRGYTGRIQAASERMATVIDDLLQPVTAVTRRPEPRTGRSQRGGRRDRRRTTSRDPAAG